MHWTTGNGVWTAEADLRDADGRLHLIVEDATDEAVGASGLSMFAGERVFGPAAKVWVVLLDDEFVIASGFAMYAADGGRCAEVAVDYVRRAAMAGVAT